MAAKCIAYNGYSTLLASVGYRLFYIAGMCTLQAACSCPKMMRIYRRAMECSRVEEVKLNEKDTSGAAVLNVTPFLHYSGGCCPWYKGSFRLEEAPAGLKVWPTKVLHC